MGATVKPLRAWAVRRDSGELLCFSDDSGDVELFASHEEAVKLTRSVGGDVVRVEVSIINEGLS